MDSSMEKKEFDERLILEVEANPALYQKTNKEYSDRYKKEEGWQYISIVLNTDVKICKDRWKNLRDTFAKCYKKEKNIPSGSQGFSNKKPWIYFEIMKFLIPNIEVPCTLGNMSPQGKENMPFDEDENVNEAPEKRKLDFDLPKPTASVKQKKKKESDADKFLAALGGMNEPESQPLDKFFSSLAQRANSWSRAKQMKLELRTLQLFHEIEFGEDDLF